ncbi:MAG: glycosyltransferase family 2 protein [Chloroflexota bacterium]
MLAVLFRSQDTLPALLRSLPNATKRPLELVLVDNCPDSPTPLGDTEGIQHVVREESERNVGFAAAVNRAATLARAPWLVLVNPDAELGARSIDTLLDAASGAPAAGVLAPMLRDANGVPTLSCYPFPTLGTIAWRHFGLSRWLPGFSGGRLRTATLGADDGKPIAVDWAQGACWLIRRDVWDELGGFDERFLLYCEEVDFCLRARRAGWQTYFVAAASAKHLEAASSRQVIRLKLASHYFSKITYFAAHHSAFSLLALRALFALDLTARVVLRLAGLPVGRPPDARDRLQCYVLVLRSILTRSVVGIRNTWATLATEAGAHRPPATPSPPRPMTA